jgi:hypothetical protein
LYLCDNYFKLIVNETYFISNFSEAATNAFKHALAFMKKIQGELILLHSYPVLPIDEQFFPENFEMVYG